jgi:hypothetical protein
MIVTHKKYLGFWKFIQKFVIGHGAAKNLNFHQNLDC